MRDGTGDFDAQQSRNAQEEAKYSGHKRSPEKHRKVPIGVIDFDPDYREFAVEEDKREEHDSGTDIGPPGELYRRIVAMRKRTLDENCVNSNK